MKVSQRADLGDFLRYRMNTEKRYYNIEFLRFAFAICIVYFHLLHSFMMDYTGNADLYIRLAEQSKYAKYIVECFFIISGYFLYHTIQRHPEMTTQGFIMRRIIRLWPVLACSIMISAVFFGKSIYASFVDLLFLQSSGLATDWQGLNWYVSAFFVVEIFYFVLYKCFRNSAKMKLLICMLIYFGYEININAMDGGFGRKMFHGIINLGMARAVAGIGLGYLFAIEWANFTATWKKQKQVQERTRGIEVWLIRVLEILTLSMLLIDFFCSSKAYDNQFIVIILFPVFFACLLTRRGVFSELTDHKMIGLPGRYAYSIYVMQEAVFAVLKRTLWKNTVFLHDYPVPALTVSILVTIMAGIVTYHLVERPATKVLKKRLQVYI
mgnify:FL=1